MTAADPQHIDAIALAIGCRTCGTGPRRMCAIRAASGLDADGIHSYRHLDAQTLLGSTDPAVHAAMLDALTRHGVLKERWRGGGIHTTNQEDAEEFRNTFEPNGRPVEFCLTTLWEAT